MEVAYTSRFSRSFRDLDEDQQRQISDAIRKFCERFPGPYPKRLRVHKLVGIKGTASSPSSKKPDVWDMHAGGERGELVITFQVEGDLVTFRNCGEHNKTIANP